MGGERADLMEWTDTLGRDGLIVRACLLQEQALGLAPGACEGQPWSMLYPPASRERLEALFTVAGNGPHLLEVDLRQADGRHLAAVAVVTAFTDPDRGPCLRTVKWPRGGALKDAARLAEEAEILASILAASDDAGWCMEWTEPVDLSAPEQEIIRQVFENGPRWRFCNAAMARLYRTPEGEDFNARPVHEVFPRTPENEDFVRRLVHADFDVNGSPSRDLRYDGVYIEVENDVRGHIRGNRLHRMWGTVRDVSKQARRAALLRERIDLLEAVLGGLPDAVVIIDRDGQILRLNMAAEELLDLSSEQVPGRALTDLVDLPIGLPDLLDIAARHVPGQPPRIVRVVVRTPGSAARADLAARRLDLPGEDQFALSLRPRLGAAGAEEPPGERAFARRRG